jgi:uncharacterized protein YcnI
MTRTTLAALTAALTLGVPAAAQAHVTIQPKTLPAGGFARIDVRVPNEQDDAGTTKVAVKMPDGIVAASYEPKPGWSVAITKKKLDTPIELHGTPMDEQIDTVTFTGRGDAGRVAPGQFVDFGLSVNVPEGDPGTKLTFPSTQTYEGGEVVRWIGPEDADKPAPTVTLLAAEGEHGAAAAGDDGHGDQAEPDEAAGVTEDELDDKASSGMATAGIVLGIVGIIAGLTGVLLAGRARRTA